MTDVDLRPPGASRRKALPTGWIVLALLGLPWAILSQFTLYKFGLVLIFAVAAIGLHVLVNWTGELSLSHAAFVGVPAFVVANVAGKNGISPVYLIPVGILGGAALGLVVGLPALRARGLRVAVVTLVFGVAVQQYFFTQRWLVGPTGGTDVPVPTLGSLDLTTPRALYPLLAVSFVASLALARALYRSKIGRALRWLRTHPEAAAAFGVPVARYKLGAYSIAGGFAGFSGALTATWVQRVTPGSFPYPLSFTFLLVVVLAGRGPIGGVLAAAGLIEGSQLFITSAGPIIQYGGPVGLLFNLTRFPSGLNGIGATIMERFTPQPNNDSGGAPVPVRRVASQLPARALLGAAVGCLAVGFVALGLAWYNAGNTDRLWVQNQEIISGGLGGLALVVLGSALLVVDRMILNGHSLTERLDRLADLAASRNPPPPAVHAATTVAAPALDPAALDNGATPQKAPRQPGARHASQP